MTATETPMFIPSYQIHNILKDFTLQLKKIRQQTAPPTGREATSPGPTREPNNLRLASVVSKVADRIMDRIADLSQEADPTAPSEFEKPSRMADRGCKSHPAAFDYYLLDRDKGKVRQRLVVEDSQHLVQRFQTLTAVDEGFGKDEQ